jgi:hypothetical protein
MKASTALSALALSMGLLFSTTPAQSSDGSEDISVEGLVKGDTYYELYPNCDNIPIGAQVIICGDVKKVTEREGAYQKNRKFAESLVVDLGRIFPGHDIIKVRRGSSRESLIQVFNPHTCTAFSLAQMQGAINALAELYNCRLAEMP